MSPFIEIDSLENTLHRVWKLLEQFLIAGAVEKMGEFGATPVMVVSRLSRTTSIGDFHNYTQNHLANFYRKLLCRKMGHL